MWRIGWLALVILACGHIIITHFVNVPSETTFDFVVVQRFLYFLGRSDDDGQIGADVLFDQAADAGGRFLPARIAVQQQVA